nr:5-bromo-4-chloroindolyl phosphate hydrolysis family protein [Clostridia bacterium]
MAKKIKKKDNSKKAGLIAFGATLLAYALIFPFYKVGHFITGGLIAAAAGWVVKTMATPLKGLDKHAKSRAALDVTIIEDEYARGVVEKGVEMLDRFKTERDAINEYVFTRRINEIRENLDKVLRQIIDDPDKAHRIRKMNSYYLPTSLKLLDSYRSAKSQGASYMTVSSTREDVLSMLDQLSGALTQVLDAMLKDDLEDMDIEIDVFERMLKSDGLQEDELTESMRQSAHAAAKEIPMSKAPTVKPTVPVQKTAAAPKPVQKPAEIPQPAKTVNPVAAPAEEVRVPEGVTLDYQVQTAHAEKTPVPYLNVPAATASARQMSEGTPVLQIPESPAAPDFADAIQKESKA